MKYRRYHVPTQPTPHIAPHPHRFSVRVDRFGLAKLLLSELFHHRGDLDLVTSRPCVYGVFSGPIGGFAPRPQHCVGCLRCTVEHPDLVEVTPNPARRRLGDSYFDPDKVDTVLYEAATGRVPVRGAGYRGAFGGEGWDSMWTDMSEIVRPTRDGIHGREFISTTVDIGERPRWLTFDAMGRPQAQQLPNLQLSLPFLLDMLPVRVQSATLYQSYALAAERLQTVALMPLSWVRELDLATRWVCPVLTPGEVEELAQWAEPPRMLELDGWEDQAFERLRRGWPQSVVAIRVGYEADLLELYEAGARVFHLVADYHGESGAGFVMDAIRAQHEHLVETGKREAVTLLGSGGIIAAEHVPKAIICGLDAVALDTAPLIALQGAFVGEVIRRQETEIRLPPLTTAWGGQRLVNMIGSWTDQLLEILGAMGLREVRRLRGETGRAMLQRELEREAFAGISGFEVQG